MAKRLIVLEGKGASWRVALWADVPVARQPFYADPNKVSAWKDAAAGELTNLRNGSVAEKVQDIDFDQVQTNPQKMATAQALQVAWQAEVNARNDWPRYGSFWDGTVWTFTNIT